MCTVRIATQVPVEEWLSLEVLPVFGNVIL